MSVLNTAIQGFALGAGFSLLVGLMNGLSTRIFPSGKTIEELADEKFGAATGAQ